RAACSSGSAGPALMLGPQALEAAALRRRQVAHRGPARREWQAAEAAAMQAGPAEQSARDTREGVIERRALRHPGPEFEAGAVDGRAEPPGKFALAPMA